MTLAFIFASFIPARRAQAAAGDLDPAFGSGGKVVTNFSPSFAEVGGIISQPDGRLVAAGDTGGFSSIDILVLRYNVNGSLDSTFGNGGKAVTDFLGYSDHAYALALQLSGRIVVVGQMRSDPSFSDIELAGYATQEMTYDLCL